MSTLHAGYISKQQWVTGFHNEISLCVKCYRMVDSEPRWQLPGPIQSDQLSITDCDDIAFGAGTLTWQDPVHSWKAGPGEVMTVKNHYRFQAFDPSFLVHTVLNIH